MKHLERIVIALLVIVVVLVARGQTQIQPRFTPPSAPTLPTHCAIGDLATQTNATAGLYVCTATDTWAIISGGGGGGGTPAAPDTSIQFNNGGMFGGSSVFTFSADPALSGGFVLQKIATTATNVLAANIYGQGDANDDNTQLFGLNIATDSISDTSSENTALQIGTEHDAGTLPTLQAIHILATDIEGGTVTTNYGIKIEDQAGGVTNYAIHTGAGLLKFGALTSTGSATGKTVVCVDTMTGVLYASTSGIACAN